MVVFCEYVVESRHRDAYLKWVRSDPERWAGVELAENEGQPGVFVEIRRASGPEEALEMEKERRDGRSWQAMLAWIKGGSDGLRIWRFRPVPTGRPQSFPPSRTEGCN